MATFLFLCFGLSAMFSMFSILRGVTAHIMRQRRVIDYYGMEKKNSIATKFLVIAFLMAATGLAVCLLFDQNFWAISNKVVIGLWLLALVFRTRFTIIESCKSLVKAIVG